MDRRITAYHHSQEVRAFIAIELPAEAREGLARLRHELERDEHRFVKWVDPSGIHLTLKFLGNIPAKRMTEITAAMQAAVQGAAPFQIEVSGLGAFPVLSQPRVLWIGVGGEVDTLSRLQRNIDSELASLGLPREERSFVPHLTLARIRQAASPPQRRSFGDLVASAGFSEKYPIRVEAISLMRSQLTPAGAVYTRLAAISLGQGAKTDGALQDPDR